MSDGSHVSIAEVVRLPHRRGTASADPAVLDHIEECPDCRTLAEGYAALRRLIRNLPHPVAPRGLQTEIAQLAGSKAEVEIARRRARRRLVAIVASTASVGVVAALLALGSWVRARGPDILESPTPASSVAPQSTPTDGTASGTTSGPRPAFVERGRSFADPRAVEEAVRDDPTIRSFREFYTAADVGANQRSMQELVGGLASGAGGRSPAECMNVILRAVPRPVLPAYVERASYQGTEAWLLVFVYAPDPAPSTPLSGVMFYAMATNDCTFLGSAFWS